MRKFIQTALVVALLIGMLPVAAQANGSHTSVNVNGADVKATLWAGVNDHDHEGNNNKHDNGFHGFGRFFDFPDFPKFDFHDNRGERSKTTNGTVTAVGSSSFTLKDADDKVFTVNIDSDTKIFHPFVGIAGTMSDIHVNDKVRVKGMVDGSQIDAKLVITMPADTHPAKAKGTVTAVSGSTITVQTNHHGVTSNVTVKTNADTMVTKSDGSAGTTADVEVGAMVKVKGLWNEILNVLNAIKIKIRA